MRYKTITTIAAILTFVNAIFFLIVPVFSLFLLGRTTNLTGQMMMRESGACAFGLGLITWSMRKSNLPEVQRVVLLGNLVVFGILVFIDLHGLITNAINMVGWIIFSADLLLFLAFILSIFTGGGGLK